MITGVIRGVLAVGVHQPPQLGVLVLERLPQPRGGVVVEPTGNGESEPQGGHTSRDALACVAGARRADRSCLSPRGRSALIAAGGIEVKRRGFDRNV